VTSIGTCSSRRSCRPVRAAGRVPAGVDPRAARAVGSGAGPRALRLPQLGPAGGCGRHRRIPCVVACRPVSAAALVGLGGALRPIHYCFSQPSRWRGGSWGSVREAGGVLAVGAGALRSSISRSPSGRLGMVDGLRVPQEQGPTSTRFWAIRRARAAVAAEPRGLSQPGHIGPHRGLHSRRLDVGLIRARRVGGYLFLPVAAACLASFRLWNKVHSPWYALWILPLFACWTCAGLVGPHIRRSTSRCAWAFASSSTPARSTPPAASCRPNRASPSDLWCSACSGAGLLLSLFVVFLRPSPEPIGSRARFAG
jgi:hypothetical protein